MSTVESDWPCLFNKPCVCDYNFKGVDCTGIGLTAIPPFINYLGGNWNMDFSNNNLTHLPEAAFKNITLASLRLSNNALTFIADGALHGSEYTLNTLYLDNNMLSEVPKEVAKLKGLYELHLDGNPMNSFDTDIMSNISKKLGTFVFGSKEMTVWPEAVNGLVQVNDLTIRNAAFETIPDNAFTNLTNIYTLTLASTNVRHLPTSMKNTRMFKLELDVNTQLKTNGFPPEAFENLSELRQFYINEGGMETLPPIFSELSVLAVLDITDTPLKYLKDDVFPKNFSTIFFEFSSNNSLFDHVPSILSKTKSLSTLVLTYNKITCINETDFAELDQLFWLHLSGNPIKTISDAAFKRNPKLYELYLDNTEITTIPKAIQNAHRLSSLFLSNTKIECTCKNLDWMKYWDSKPKNFQIHGDCYNIRMSLIDYVNKEIPKC